MISFYRIPGHIGDSVPSRSVITFNHIEYYADAICTHSHLEL